MKFPVFSLKNREFGFSETGSLLTASSSEESCELRIIGLFFLIGPVPAASAAPSSDRFPDRCSRICGLSGRSYRRGARPLRRPRSHRIQDSNRSRAAPALRRTRCRNGIGHFTTLEPASTRETIDRISVGGRLSSRRIARHPQCRDGLLCVALSAIRESVIEGSLSLLTSGRRLVERCAAVMANSSARRPG